MDVDKVFHMTGGVGDTSYARNSSLQKKGSDMVKNITLQTLQELYLATAPKSLGIADLGCSSGGNSFAILREMVDAIEEASRKVLLSVPEFRVYLNDLPTNDFNSIFKAVPEFYRQLRQGRRDGGPSIYVAGYPGTFYGRLFPSECLHFIYSSYSLHWLSRIPTALYDEQGSSINKGGIYISESSPPAVSKAYFRQFQDDFSLFLGSRSQELVAGGRMVLIFLGRIGASHADKGNSFLWELLSRSFAILVSQGEVEKEKVDSYEVHFYAASKDEIEEQVKREGSFEMERLETFEIGEEVEADGGNKILSYGTVVARTVRAIQESMIRHHFGEGISLDCLFKHYARLVDEEMAKHEIRPITCFLILRKI
ncbi:probable methyltransferase TCM_000336 [Diospyros lotus]|uniref:probable methyltransferase TCM_000336 n=1 Tax=Diospyros lotus TaxID=55363 RepID=UPI00224FDA3A|nr:probable methyltransferase TCM_000336 [Diospyros lotus]